MALRVYWTGSVFAAEWTLTAAGAAVTGEVTRPDQSTAAMGVESSGDPTHLLSFQPTVPGRHAARLEASGPVAGAEEVSFVVRRSLVGLPPIDLDPTGSIGRVRLLSTDTDEDDPIFSDDQIAAFIAMETGIKRAAALALETLAVSEALVNKRITTQDLSIDGPAVAKSLLDRAAVLRKRAQEEQDEQDSDDYGLEIVALSSFPCPPYYGDWNL